MLLAAAYQLKPINDLRNKYDLNVQDPFSREEITSELRIPTVVLFTFRSLAIDYLWIRADKLKNEGQYFDALHLARLICELQPNLASVWDFQAWNMAYNISVAMPTPQQRWDWVKAGFELLRDQGLKYNPKSLKIHHSLAWIFEHKIGAISDDYHRYYKLRLALEMTPMLSPFYDRDRNIATNADIEALAGAPKQWTQLLADPQVASLIEKIKQTQPDFTDNEKMADGLLKLRFRPTQLSPELHQLIADNFYNEALKKLDWFIRANQLRGKWKLEPHRMLKINKLYGPVDYEDQTIHYSLDWRLPFTHAIYWAVQGLERAKGKYDFDETRLRRVVYHSLQDMYHFGQVKILPFARPTPTKRKPGQEIVESQQIELKIFNSEDLRMFPIAYKATLDLMQSYIDANKKISGGIIDGSVNLAKSGIQNLYLTGHTKMAQQYLDFLRKNYPDKLKKPDASLTAFVAQEMREEIANIDPKNASNYTQNLFRNAYLNLAIGHSEKAAIMEKWAQQVYHALLKEFPDLDDPTSRTKLPPLEEIRWQALMNFLADRWVDTNVKNYLMQRIKNTNTELFDRVMSEIQKQRKTTKQNITP